MPSRAREWLNAPRKERYKPFQGKHGQLRVCLEEIARRPGQPQADHIAAFRYATPGLAQPEAYKEQYN